MYVALLKSTLAGKVFAVDVAFVGKESQAPPSTARERRSSGGAKSGCVPHAAPLALDPSDQPSAVTDEMLPAVADGGGGGGGGKCLSLGGTADPRARAPTTPGLG